MNKKIFTLSVIITLAALYANCQTTSTVIDVNGGNIQIGGTTMNVPDYTKWHYFSFTTGNVVGTSDFTLVDINENNKIGTEVPNADWEARTDWDIAFHATDIRTNNAQAILIADTTSQTPLADVFSNLAEAPAEGYNADEILNGTFISSMASMPPPRATQMSVCGATHGWATFGQSGNATKAMVVVFKISEDKYVKVFLKNFFDSNDNPGYIDISYQEIPVKENSINDSEKINLSVYPNPAKDVLTIKSCEDTSAIIYNAIGVAVKKSAINAGENKIQISDLPAGTYFIKINDLTKKLIVN
jgi:hypothetical protein